MTAKRKRGLGRGLDALIGAQKLVDESHQEPASKEQGGELQSVPVDLIERGRYQPRKTIDDDSIAELADSIKAQGLMQPIVIRPIGGGRYEIIAGERRWRATQHAGIGEIDALIRDVPDEAAIAMALIENIQRENLNPMEEAFALARLKDEFELTHEEVAQAVGKSRSAVTNLLRLTQLQDRVRSLVENGDLEMGHARALLSLEPAMQLSAANEVVEKALSVRQTEALARTLQAQPAQKANIQATNKSADIKALEKDLSQKLGSPVSIDHNKNGKGKLVIRYASTDILEGILDHIR